VANRGSPTVRRRRLGMELRRLRDAANITIDVVADQLDCSSSKVSRIETGHIGASPRDVRDMLTIYGADAEKIEELMQIAREARQKGWWHLYGSVLTGAYVGLEQEAERVRSYEAQCIPGLFQTPAYASLIIQAAKPDILQPELERRIDLRMQRQSLLIADLPLDFWAILDESILRRIIGSKALMHKQLDIVLEMAKLPNVTLQVLPYSAGAHPAMDGSFTILEYEEVADPDVVFATNAAGGLFLEKEDEVDRHKYLFDHLRASALPPHQSVAMIGDVMKELL
jgi:transcriptional regulator with XRE-family HTH domain